MADPVLDVLQHALGTDRFGRGKSRLVGHTFCPFCGVRYRASDGDLGEENPQ